MAIRPNSMRKSDLENEFNNDYTGPIDMGHAGNEDMPDAPRIVGGMGHAGSQDQLMPLSESGVGHGGNEDLPGAPTKVGGDGRGGLPENAEQGELMLEASGI